MQRHISCSGASVLPWQKIATFPYLGEKHLMRTGKCGRRGGGVGAGHREGLENPVETGGGGAFVLSSTSSTPFDTVMTGLRFLVQGGARVRHGGCYMQI